MFFNSLRQMYLCKMKKGEGGSEAALKKEKRAD